MLVIERQQAILDYITKNHSATVKELSDKFFVGETSIRRDLSHLVRTGLIRKTYGGAVLLPGANDILALDARQNLGKAEKRRIAQKASQLIMDGDIVFLDSSSTSLSMVPFLKAYNSLTVVTHSIQTALQLLHFKNIKVYLAGGLIHPTLKSCSGAFTRGVFQSMQANKAFISPRAVSLSGKVFCTGEEEMAVRKTIMEQSEKTILICNSAKLDHSAPFMLCGLRDIAAVVCEKKPSKEWLDIFAENDVDCV
jgi:DeoR family myo-inositol catabolism operon transcriptional repressor